MSRGEFENVCRALGGWQTLVDPNAKDKQTGNQSSTVQLYKWTGNPDKAFEPVE